MDDEGGEELFEDVAVLFEEEGEEFFDVVGDDVEFDAFFGGGLFIGEFDGLEAVVEAEDFFCGEDVGAAEVPVGVGGGEAVEVCAGDGGEEEGAGMGCDFGVEAGVDGEHGIPLEPRRAQRTQSGLFTNYTDFRRL